MNKNNNIFKLSVLSVIFILSLSSTLIVNGDNDFIVGVCTHLMSPPVSLTTVTPPLDAAIGAGLASVRDTPYWSSVEFVKGQLTEIYEFNDFMVALQPRTSLSKLFILGNGNQHYNNGQKPQGTNITVAFTNYVQWVVNKYKGKVQFYEVWNEWDLDDPGNPNTATHYMQLANAAIPVIRANDPNAKILGGCITSDGMDQLFGDRVIQQGLATKVDGLSIHPYNFCGGTDNTPEVWFRWVNLTNTRWTGLRNGVATPLYITEMTWPSSHPSTCGSTLEIQAAYLARVYFLARVIPNIKGMWWYDIFDDGVDFYDREHNFGLLDHNWSPKPAYFTMKSITPFISNYTYDATKSVLASGSLYKLAFYRNLTGGAQHRVISAWSSNNAATVTTTLTTQSVVPLDLVKVWYTTPYANMDGQWVNSGFKWTCVGFDCTATVTVGKFPVIFDVTGVKCACLP
ncbi:hypothetical protein PPL_04540 [Heterostelium album PN500]|uniref:Glycoside hydrolase family 5 domain-containing protein n=1 Tax=Heterostelium pallidum (strain ATCC 26659 / Pp 5 / PN500) TaxID=670386 RepID=D3B7V2_HETP5|nr:hypothetical protein PPL_04540 [Heterostelium album PN500]EFA82845.1 hypothetical protein PPL_04540 [Heterostelium album PN500]|eukprot:XP_020434962.1 hypothetical protein PPL_04540 [Heterostelium album PN500]